MMQIKENEGLAHFWEHVESLRKVVLRAFLAVLFGLFFAFYFHQEIIHWILQDLPGSSLYLFSPSEGFIAVFRLSFWLGVLVTSPYWMWGFTQFIKPALRLHEKQSLLGFFFLSLLFIGSGILLCVKMTLPLANQYLYAFNWTIGTNMWGFGAYLDFILMLVFAHGIAFELGALLLFLVHIGVLKGDALAAKRRHAIVAALVIGALLTPPDVFTQLAIALPLMGFYELAILYGKKALKRVSLEPKFEDETFTLRGHGPGHCGPARLDGSATQGLGH